MTNEERMKKLDEIEAIWREMRYTLRKLSDIYNCEYNTLYTTVQQAVNKVVDIDKLAGK